MNKKTRLIDYQEELIKSLQDPEEAAAYLNAALMDEDPRIFLIALKNVIDAQEQDISSLARKAQLNRENLYRMLSNKGNPKLTSIVSLLDAVGLHFEVQPHRYK